MKTPLPVIKIKVGKLEAATRQLHTAIEMWFNGGDLVAIHTLVAAAYQIISDLITRQGLGETLYNSPVFKDEFRKEVNTTLRKSQNFFKHSGDNPDPQAEHEFWVGEPEFLMMFSLQGLRLLKVDFHPARRCFFTWFSYHNPKFIKPEKREEMDRLYAPARELFEGMDKAQFYATFMAASRIATMS